MVNGKPSRVQIVGWQVEPAQTGLFVRTLPTPANPKGNILCRVAGGCAYFWDRDSKQEIEIPLERLMQISSE